MSARTFVLRTLARPSSIRGIRPSPRRVDFQSYSRAILPASQSIAQTRIQRRWQSSSAPAEDWKVWGFDEVKKLVDSKNRETILIDVREPREYSSGHIPSAQNMPITSSADALFLSAEDFEDRFGFPKPRADANVLFYCKAGVRSKAAAVLARQVGYQNVGEYRGSWDDWAKNGGDKA